MFKPLAGPLVGRASLVACSLKQAGPSPVMAITRSFHASSINNVKKKHLKAVERVQKHFARMMAKPKPQEVDPVLGRAMVPFMERVKARVSESTNQVMGIDPLDSAKLMYGAERAALERSPDFQSEAVFQEEEHKRKVVQRILSMQNASQKQFRKLAVEYAVKEFGRFEGDTGSSEVQAAVATIHIHYMVNFLREHKKNYTGLRKLEQKVQQRQTILKYLKKDNPKRYFWAIEKLGLTDDAVTKEFHLSRTYFAKVRFFGDKTLPVKPNKKERAEQNRLDRLKKKAKRFIK
uniref:ARAD1D28754p n=1 Tax=Blastobotrys adeninivorans TaxID=409370 RepID=A0A060TAT8_BLAAD